LLAFRLTGGSKGFYYISDCFFLLLSKFIYEDYIAVGSDSGRIVILEYLPQKKIFDRVHQVIKTRNPISKKVAGDLW
jgi:hypothetical protein